MISRPMLAATFGTDAKKHITELTFPYYASPKIDGVRCRVVGGVAVTRKGEPFKCPDVQDLFGLIGLEGLDGELCLGAPTDKNLLQRTQKLVTSPKPLSPDDRAALRWHVFDRFLPGIPEATFTQRAQYARALVENIGGFAPLAWVPHLPVYTQDDLEYLEEKWLEEGYEGVMLNAPDAAYKHGRSGKLDPELIKVKRFSDSEAVVVDAVELQHNDNALEQSVLGYAKRSHAKAGKRAGGVLGALVCETIGDEAWPEPGVTFEIGAGFTARQREDIWSAHARGGLVGRVVTFKHFAVTGVLNKPRNPVFRCFRED